MKENFSIFLFSILARRCRTFHHIIMYFCVAYIHIYKKGILKKGYKDMNTFHLTVCHSDEHEDNEKIELFLLFLLIQWQMQEFPSYFLINLFFTHNS